jgi:hypothetical protein
VYNLIVDVSSVEGGISSILTEIDKYGKFHAISYASKQIIKHEKDYSPFLLEMDVVVRAKDYKKKYLLGRRLIHYTDHKPLET